MYTIFYMFLACIILFTLPMLYLTFKIYTFIDRTNLILEEMYLLLRDGDGEGFFNAENNSYEVIKANRDKELDERNKVLKRELSMVDELEVITDRLEIQRIIDEDSTAYAKGVYDLDHKKIDASLLDNDEYAD